MVGNNESSNLVDYLCNVHEFCVEWHHSQHVGQVGKCKDDVADNLEDWADSEKSDNHNRDEPSSEKDDVVREGRRFICDLVLKQLLVLFFFAIFTLFDFLCSPCQIKWG